MVMNKDVPEKVVKLSKRGMVSGVLIIIAAIIGKNIQLTFIVDFNNTTLIFLSLFGCLLIFSSFSLLRGLRWAYWVALIFSFLLLSPWLICLIPLLIFWTVHPQAIAVCIVIGIFYAPIGLVALSNIRSLITLRDFFGKKD